MFRFLQVFWSLGIVCASECAVRLINEADSLATVIVHGRQVDTLTPHTIGSYSDVDCPVVFVTVVL